MFMLLRALVIVLVATVAMAASSAQAKMAWPSRSTPVQSTHGWFKAINAHNRNRVLFYIAPSATEMIGWAQPARAWPKFTDLDCAALKTSTRRARVRCTFHELGPMSVVANRDTFWDVYLRHTQTRWLIDNYGQR
jgi:hypothetical protein